MTEVHDVRSTTDAPAGGDGACCPTARQLAATRRAKDEPTLADANEDFRKISTAIELMQEWGVHTIEDAFLMARNRVRGASRRAGHDRQG